MVFGGRTASLSELLPMLQSMGVEVLESGPSPYPVPTGPISIYQFKITPRPTVPLARPDRNGKRLPSASPTP